MVAPQPCSHSGALGHGVAPALQPPLWHRAGKAVSPRPQPPSPTRGLWEGRSDRHLFTSLPDVLNTLLTWFPNEPRATPYTYLHPVLKR
ncbi:unnamed protein product [Rangifer tarandus platyrhynchus]|uniref:Uncharacterized protein n=1 Tax=Rangifer tarandus platyrhynchus TaxID=3082113 RepID=A0AC59ZI76_RANTA